MNAIEYPKELGYEHGYEAGRDLSPEEQEQEIQQSRLLAPDNKWGRKYWWDGATGDRRDMALTDFRTTGLPDDAEEDYVNAWLDGYGDGIRSDD